MRLNLNEMLDTNSAFQGLRCEVDLVACQLHLGQGAERVSLPLATAQPSKQPVLQNWSQGICLISPDTAVLRATSPWESGLRYGLNVGPEKILLLRDNEVLTPYLAQSHTLIHSGYYARRPAQGPYDLFVSADHSLLAVANRSEGWVQIVDLAQREEVARGHFPGFAGPGLLAVALDPVRQRAWLAGPEQRQICAWDYLSQQQESLSGPWKQPVNLLMLADQLWVLDNAGKMTLWALSLPERQVMHQLDLAMSSYAADTDTPGDLLYSLDQGRRLAVMGYQNLPDPLTPQVSVIDTETGRIVNSFQPSSRTWPVLIASGTSNPALEQLRSRNSFNQEQTEAELPSTLKALLRGYGLSWQRFQSRLLVLHAEPAPAVPLHHQTRELIFGEIREALAEEHGVKLPSAPRTPEEKELMVHAEKIAQLLRTHSYLDVILHNVLNGLTLGLRIEREALLKGLQQRGWLDAGSISAEPAPEAEPAPPAPSALPEGWLGIADPLNSRLLQLNAEREVVWSLDTSIFGIYRPSQVCWPDPEHFVVLDGESAQISCWNLSGQQVWALEGTDNIWNRIVTRDNQELLLLDSGQNSLMQVSPSSGRVSWALEDEIQPLPGKVLDFVLAPDNSLWLLGEKGVVWHVIPGESLTEAFRFPGHPAILALSPDGNTLGCFDGQVQKFWTWSPGEASAHSCDLPPLDSQYRISQALGLSWPTDDILVVHDGYRLLACQLSTQQLLSRSLLQHVRLKPGTRNLSPQDTFTALAQREHTVAGGSQTSLSEMLSRVPLFQQAPESFLQDLVNRVRTRVFNRGDEIVRKGDSGNEMFLIRQGRVEVLGANALDIVARMNTGDVFGEVALMLGLPRNATVRASVYSELFSIQQSDLDELLPHYPSVRERLLQLAHERQTQQQLRSELEQQRLRERIQALSAQRVQQAPAARPAQMTGVSEPSPDLPIPALWLRHTASGQLAQRHPDQRLDPILGAQQHLVMPVKALSNDTGFWVLDMGQNLLIKVNPHGALLTGQILSWPDVSLNQPRDLARDAADSLWIANTGAAELLRLSPDGSEVLQRLQVGTAPVSLQCLPAGRLLVSDLRQHTVSEYAADGELLWQYGTPRRFGRDENRLFAPEFSCRLDSGHTLIADTGNNRVIEVTPEGRIAWSAISEAGLRITRPTYCQRLATGETLIEHSNRSRWIALTPQLQEVWRYTLPLQGFESIPSGEKA
ncbi:MAG: cyclic nucleotide-binding domain-containing protein [Candidatus Sericytochromatia bacterium]